jgi:flagellar biogenesis protein FliO
MKIDRYYIPPVQPTPKANNNNRHDTSQNNTPFRDMLKKEMKKNGKLSTRNQSR